MTIRILYFASLAQQLNQREESLTLDNSTLSIGDLKHTLSARGEQWQRLINDRSTRCALNQQLCNDSTLLTENCEVAFFPPVTGG